MKVMTATEASRNFAAVLDEAEHGITIAELHVGVELADEARRPARQAFVDQVLALIPIEEYTTDVARVHARLMARVRREGKTPYRAYDLLIAATAAAAARTLVTMDSSAAFDDLPGVRAQVVPR
ncbi:PIN domain-containing protein [Microbispora sp. H10830]|uniref:PIN domain-containing protein n=1 Tax=Microbispora sp. H10830 TaxID=2729109 RepID=UPI0015FEFD38|nr:PIN domain-containing protein [Microbispora sp. H10830]